MEAKENETFNNIDSNTYHQIVRNDRYVVYKSGFETNAVINKVNSTSGSETVYRVGRRYKLFQIRNDQNQNLHENYRGDTNLDNNNEQNDYNAAHPDRYCDQTFLKNRDVNRVKQDFTYSNEYKECFSNYNRKNLMFSNEVNYGDMSMIVFNLTLMLCFYNLNNYLDFGKIRTNQNELRISSIESSNVQNNITESSMFIPNCVNSTGHPAVFYALVMAAHLGGASILTDHLQIDAETRVPQIQTYKDRNLADGAYEALKLMFTIFDMNGAGSLANIAFTKALHECLTVVGHSDEGGFMRHVFRKCNFCIPHGFIVRPDSLPINDNGAVPQFVVFPNLSKCQQYKLQNFLHGMALKTAGLVAEAQPLVTYEDRCYPFLSCADEELVKNIHYNNVGEGDDAHETNIFEVNKQEIEDLYNSFGEDGDNADATEEQKQLLWMQLIQRQRNRMLNVNGNDENANYNYDDETLADISRSHWNNIAEVAGDFSRLYVQLLDKIIEVSGNSEKAIKFMITQFDNCLNDDDRHLHQILVCPFFWIEPTGLFKYKLGTNAENAGFACLNGFMENEREIDAFEDVSDVSKRNDRVYTFKSKFRSARTSGQILFNQYSLRDGLGSIKIVQSATDDWTLYGGEDSIYNMLDSEGTHPEQIVSIDQMLWQKGDNPICHPAECMYIGEQVMIRIEHRGYNNRDMIEVRNVFDPDEMMMAKIKFCVSRPRSIGIGTIDQIPQGNNRERRLYDHIQRRNNKAARIIDRMYRMNKHCPNETGNQYETGNVLTPSIRIVFQEKIENNKDQTHELVSDEQPELINGQQKTFGRNLALRTVDVNVKPRPANNRNANANANIRVNQQLNNNDDNVNENSNNGGEQIVEPPNEQ